ncbi:MAG: TIGR00730 family Rossman fold protein [Puniceicoccaceae bacterium]|nr:MAG: TIGR00730 family Rossman fold protein [Puniceicoccaceae bacterium]
MTSIPGNPEPWPTKAYKNLEFLNSPHARSIRVMCELTEPQRRFEKNQISNTIVFFGSARLRPEAKAKAEVAAAEAALEKEEGDTAENRLRLEVARQRLRGAPYYDQARELARRLGEWGAGFERPEQRFHVMSGGGPGIMEASNRGAGDAGAQSIGLGISLPHEERVNPYCTPELSFEFHYFFVRKYWFLYLAKAIVVFPGGFGTLDELFELLTLIQTRKTQKYMPIVLYGSAFWNRLIDFNLFVEWGLISPEDLQLFKVLDGIEETYAFLTSELTNHHKLPAAGPKA